jgi:N-methylhydantoinase B
VDAAATDARRRALRARRTAPLPVIDRGLGYDKMLRGEFKPWKRSV